MARGDAMEAWQALPEAEVWSILPRPLPVDWFCVGRDDSGGGFQRRDGLCVIASVSREADGRRWIHVSVSWRGGRMPTWQNLRDAKDLFIGRERIAVQVLPRQRDYYDLKGMDVLHLWSCLDGPDIVPDFRKEGKL